MNNRRLFAIVLTMAAAIALTWTAPATAGTWSGSTRDNGMGQSVSGQGSSTEKQDPADLTGCTIIYTSTTTITVTDNSTGKVVSTTTRTRIRKYKIKNCPAGVKVVARPAKNDVLIVPVIQGTKADIQVQGSTTGSTTVTNNPDGSKTTKKTEESSGPGGYKRSDSTATTDKNGTTTGGSSKTVVREGGKRTVTGQNWDPKTSGWVDIPATTVPLTLQSTSLLLPNSASRGGYLQGVVLANSTTPDGSTDQSVASASVTITEQSGKHFKLTTLGEILLAGSQIEPMRMTVEVPTLPKTSIPISNDPPATEPNITTSWSTPPVVTNASSLTLDGSGLATDDGPMVLACTRAGCQPTRIMTASDKQLKFDVPTLPPGACDLIVENGNGRFSGHVAINPVDVALELPKGGHVGETLNAVVRLTGLVPENLNRSLQATVNLLGPGTFENGGTSQVVTFSNGVAHFKMTAHAAGTLDVNVRDVH